MTHIPKGEMCLGCSKLHDNCNHLKFSEMRPIAKPDREGCVVVRCTEYRRSHE